MSGLVLNLKPHEKFLINGAVLQNGGRRTQIRVMDTDIGVLRFSDALHPDDVRTPLTRAYFAAQSIITGDAEEAHAKPILIQLLRDAHAAFSDFSFEKPLVCSIEMAKKGKFYNVIKALRPLLPHEAMIFASLPTVNHR